jgi:RNA recognition motif-containing protein
VSAKVFVGNLSFQTSKEALGELLSQAGQVVDVFLPTDRATQRPRGFAFVEFATEEEAAEAIRRFDGHALDGRSLRVNAAEDRPPGSRPPMGGGSSFGSSSYAPAPGKKFKSKGSRRGLRGKKRSL